MTKGQCLNLIENKQLVIKGAGKIANVFFSQYGNVYNIKYCTSNKEDDCIQGLERIEINSIIEEKEKYFIIVCIGDYEDVSFELTSKGLCFGYDFLPYGLFIALKQNKQVFLAVGQCELYVTDYIFKHIESLKSKMEFMYYDEYKVLGIEDKQPQLLSILEVNELIEMADYFIYPINLTDRNKYYEELRRKVNKSCIVVTIPLATFEGYWPQDSKKNYYEKSPYYLDVSLSAVRRDVNIESAVESKDESIIDRIMSDQFYDTEFVLRYFNKTIRKFELLERKSDLKISDFYREQYMNQRLFMDRGHASGNVLREYAKRILEFCQIECAPYEIYDSDLDWYENCHNEVPLYPSVEKVLFKTVEKEYRWVQEDAVSYITREEYFKRIYNITKLGFEYISNLKNIEKAKL